MSSGDVFQRFFISAHRVSFNPATVARALAIARIGSHDRNGSGVPNAGDKIHFYAKKSNFIFVPKRPVDSTQSYILNRGVEAAGKKP